MKLEVKMIDVIQFYKDEMSKKLGLSIEERFNNFQIFEKREDGTKIPLRYSGIDFIEIVNNKDNLDRLEKRTEKDNI